MDFTSININKHFREREGKKGHPGRDRAETIRPDYAEAPRPVLGEREAGVAGKQAS